MVPMFLMLFRTLGLQLMQFSGNWHHHMISHAPIDLTTIKAVCISAHNDNKTCEFLYLPFFTWNITSWAKLSILLSWFGVILYLLESSAERKHFMRGGRSTFVLSNCSSVGRPFNEKWSHRFNLLSQNCCCLDNIFWWRFFSKSCSDFFNMGASYFYCLAFGGDTFTINKRFIIPRWPKSNIIVNLVDKHCFICIFCPGTMTTHAESINSDLQRRLDRRLRHTALDTEQNQLAINHYISH